MLTSGKLMVRIGKGKKDEAEWLVGTLRGYGACQELTDAVVDHELPNRLLIKLCEEGMHWDRGEEMEIYDTSSGNLNLFNTPDEVAVEVVDFNRTVFQMPAKHIDPALPGKTLVFCVNDLHADLVVR